MAEMPCQAPKLNPAAAPCACADSMKRFSSHGNAEIGLHAEEARREHARQMPVALRVEQGRSHPSRERPEAAGPQHEQDAK
jgi:hypothetical protein